MISWAHVLAIVILFASIVLYFYTYNKKVILAGVVFSVMFAFPMAKITVINFRNYFSLASPNIVYAHRHVTSDVYIYNSTHRLNLLYYHSSNNEKKPLIISIHGGAWSSGGIGEFEKFNFWLAQKGFAVADVEYRLAPKHTFPAQIEDVVYAFNYLVENADSLGVDTSHVYLLGRSAGGQIAAAAACRLGNKKIKGTVCFYTPFDVEWGYSVPGNPFILDSRKVLRDYLGGSPEQVPDNYKYATVTNLISHNTPPFLLLHGDKDEMVAYGHNLRLLPVLEQYGIKYQLIKIPFGTHGFDYFFHSPAAQMANEGVLKFLRTPF